jgi:sugar phosphate isomerase/epimerase
VNSLMPVAFSTLAFPDATLASAVSLGLRWGYAGVELRLTDGDLIDPSMPAADRARVKRTVAAAGLPVVAVDSSIRLTGDDPVLQLRRFLELASDWESPLVRVFGGALPADGPPRQQRLRAAARVLEASARTRRSRSSGSAQGPSARSCRAPPPSPASRSGWRLPGPRAP